MCKGVREKERDASKPSQIKSLISTQSRGRRRRRGEDKVREVGGTQISLPSNIPMGCDRRGEHSGTEGEPCVWREGNVGLGGSIWALCVWMGGWKEVEMVVQR